MRIHDFHAAAAGGSAGAVPLYWWQGWTGRWHVASVMRLVGFACSEPGTYVLARCETDGRRTPLMVGWADDVEADLCGPRAEELADAVARGASEVHVHLLADEHWQRAAVGRDLARAWELPLPR